MEAEENDYNCAEKYQNVSELEVIPEVHVKEEPPDEANELIDPSLQNLTNPADYLESLEIKELKPKEEITCKFCGREFDRKCSLAIHMKTHTPDGRSTHECQYCGKVFKKKSFCRDHELSHTGEKPFKCKLCPKAFTRTRQLQIHVIRVHPNGKEEKNNDKLYPCEYCDKSYKNKSHYTVHVRIHTGEKPYKCSHCDATFTFRRELTDHESIHTGVTRFQCDFCDKQFNDKTMFRNHQRTHSDGKPFKCDYCEMTFKFQYSLNSHLFIHNRNTKETFECELCPSSFEQQYYLDRHYKQCHPTLQRKEITDDSLDMDDSIESETM